MARLGLFKRFFLLIFSPGRSGRSEKRALAVLIKQLQQADIRIYAPVPNTVLPVFAEKLLDLKALLWRLRPVLLTTLAAEDPARVRNSQYKLLQIILKAKNLSYAAFQFESIMKSLEDKKVDRLLAAEAVFNKRISVFNEKFITQLKTSYLEILRIAGLCAFDFDALVEQFRGGNRFRGCDGRKILGSLEDLYFVSAKIRVDRKFLSIVKMLQFIAGTNPIRDEEILSILAGIGNSIDDIFSETCLGSVIRAIREDPFYELQTEAPETTFIEDFRDKLVKQFILKKTQYENRVAEEDMKRRVKGLFGEGEILELTGYTETDSSRFREAGIGNYKYIFPLRIIKTFLSSLFIPEIKPFLDNFWEEAEFFTEETSIQARELSGSMEVLAVQLEKFQEDLTSAEYSAVPGLKQRLNGNGIIESELKKAQKIVQEVNRDADRIVQQMFETVSKLLQLVSRIREDLKRDDQVVLLNALFLKRNKSDLVFGIKKQGDRLQQFLGVMKSIAVNLSAAKGGLKEKPG